VVSELSLNLIRGASFQLQHDAEDMCSDHGFQNYFGHYGGPNQCMYVNFTTGCLNNNSFYHIQRNHFWGPFQPGLDQGLDRYVDFVPWHTC